jgi:hypothetical protein
MAAGDRGLTAALIDSSGAGQGVFTRSFDGNEGWMALGAVGIDIRSVGVSGVEDGYRLACRVGQPNVIYQAGADSTWVARDDGIEEWYAMTLLAGYPYPGRSYASLLFTSGAVATSTDFGSTWMVNPLPGWGFFSYLAAKPTAPLECWGLELGSYGDAVPSVSTDGGVTWTALPAPVATAGPRDIAVFPTESNSFVIVSGDIGGFLSLWEDGSYEPSGSPGPGGGFSAIGVEIPAWDPGMTYVAGWVPTGHLAVYRCRNLRQGNWEEVGFGLEIATCASPDPWGWPNNDRFQFVAARGAPVLYLSASDAGLWTILLSDVVSAPPAAAAGESMCSPALPGVSSGVVRWTVSPQAGGVVSARVLDINGRLVARLSPATIGEETTLSWDGSTSLGTRVSSGTYFLHLRTTEGKEAVRRFVRLR